MATAVIYYRVSSERQVEGTSLETQEEQCRTLVARSGWDMDSSWPEEGVSAKTANRPVLQRMLKYCHANRKRIDYVVFPKIDRMARNVFDYLDVKGILLKDGIRFVSVGEKIEETPAGRFTEHIMAAQAQFDNEQRGERCKGGMEAAVKKEGRWVWLAPFGYSNGKINGQPNIVPSAEAATLRWIFSEVASRRQSPDAVYKEALLKGYDRCKSQFYKMLSNPVYIGLIPCFGGEWAGSFAPLVQEETYRRVQTCMRRGRPVRQYMYLNPDFPLKKTLRCRCHIAMTGTWSTGRSQRYPYYRCFSCSAVSIPRAEAHDKFRELLRSLNLSLSEAGILRDRILENLKDEKNCVGEIRSRLEADLRQTSELQRGLAMKSAAGVIPDDVAKVEFAALKERISAINEDIESTDTPQHIDEKALSFGIDLVTKLDAVWSEAETELQVRLQSYFFPDGVTMDKKKNFATAQSPLLELKKMVQSPNSSYMVDHSRWSSNQQVKTLSGMFVALSTEF